MTTSSNPTDNGGDISASSNPSPSQNPTETLEQGEALTLHYNDENAEQVITQIKNSVIPVHVIVEASVTSIGSEAFYRCIAAVLFFCIAAVYMACKSDTHFISDTFYYAMALCLH